MKINAFNMNYVDLNNKIKNCAEDIEIEDCYGQRFIGSVLEKNKTLYIKGYPRQCIRCLFRWWTYCS